jgi:hypothetical protein
MAVRSNLAPDIFKTRTKISDTSVRGRADPWAIVWLQGLSNRIAPRLELPAFRILPQCLSQLCYCRISINQITILEKNSVASELYRLSDATCRRNLVPTFVDRGVSPGQRDGSPTVVSLGFSRLEPLIFFYVAPHLLSQGLSGPRTRTTATQKIC